MFINIKKSNINKGYIVDHSINPSNTPRGGRSLIIKEIIQHFEEEKLRKEQIQITTVI